LTETIVSTRPFCNGPSGRKKKGQKTGKGGWCATPKDPGKVEENTDRGEGGSKKDGEVDPVEAWNEKHAQEKKPEPWEETQKEEKWSQNLVGHKTGSPSAAKARELLLPGPTMWSRLKKPAKVKKGGH